MNTSAGCRVCNKNFKGMLSLAVHLDWAHGMSRGHGNGIGSKLYYDTYIKAENEGACLRCGNQTRFMDLHRGYNRYCSCQCGGIDNHRKGVPNYVNRGTWEEKIGKEKADLRKEALRKYREGKTYDEIFGKDKSLDIRMRQSKHSGMKREEVRLKLKGKKRSDDFKKRLSAAKTGVKRPDMVGAKNPSRRPEIIAKIKSYWNNPEWVEKFFSKVCRKPNTSEARLLSMVDELCPGEYAYNDGWLTIMYKVPDIVNINGQKKVIELYGDYWHKGENSKKRISLFRKAGYSTLVVWERELQDSDSLTLKIAEFHYGD